jgi:hypothetical protein
LLPGYRILLHEGIVALEIDLGRRQQRLVSGQLPPCLEQCRFVRRRVDLHEQRPFLDDISFFKGDLQHLAVDLGE